MTSIDHHHHRPPSIPFTPETGDTGVTSFELHQDLAARVDPAHTLPSASIRRTWDPGIYDGQVTHDYYLHAPELHEGVIVTATVTEDTLMRERYIESVRIKSDAEHLKGKGLGLVTYLAIAQDSIRSDQLFRSNPIQFSEHAKGVWDLLVATGVAKTVREPQPLNPDSGGTVYYKGIVAVCLPSSG